MNNKKARVGMSVLALAGLPLVAPQVSAFDYAVSGFIRQEMAYKLSNTENPNTTGGNHFNGKSYVTQGKFLPPGQVITGRRDLSTDNDWNVFATKSEIDVNFSFSNNVTGFAKFRGYYQPDVFDEVDKSGFVDGDGGQPDHFGVPNHGNEATHLSISGDDYMLDMPALYLDYAKGPLWVRIGQQQIAWGEALFFRVADMANGLDFRRHVIFDFGAEEYSDERLSSPGIRASYQVDQNWEVEVFAQMFQPTILPTNYSPYNLIQSGFNMNKGYEEGFDKVDDAINGGIRVQGQNLGEDGSWGVQLFAVTRHNPDPIFTLHPSGINNLAFPVLPNQETGELLDFSSQPFIYEPGSAAGTASPTEWFYNSGIAGADGLDVVNGLIHDFPWIKSFAELGLGLTPNANGDYLTSIAGGGHNTLGGAFPSGINGNDFLELFWQAGLAGGGTTLDGALGALDSLVGGSGLSGLMRVSYASENIFGFGVNHIIYAGEDSFLDQLVMRFEMSYTPNKKFTNNLRYEFIEEDEVLASFVLEKYHRFSDSFPATFMIFEYMYRKESDLLGRHLSGLGGTVTKRPGGGEQDRGWHGTVLAFQQPFPGLKWRLDGSFLYDFEGGFLFQPAVRYKPNGDWTVEAFANIIDGNNSSSLGVFDWSDDFTMRITYQF
ncbi:MAG: hypothetical protein KBT88_09975 [Gammaproteobacteria bacterium]|nr:hypothetical protein [Gammaproteobacteria bacterium]MBQ0840103.1 hypothetical protein [Gammaproteobacteria bacterium]